MVQMMVTSNWFSPEVMAITASWRESEEDMVKKIANKRKEGMIETWMVMSAMMEYCSSRVPRKMPMPAKETCSHYRKDSSP